MNKHPSVRLGITFFLLIVTYTSQSQCRIFIPAPAKNSPQKTVQPTQEQTAFRSPSMQQKQSPQPQGEYKKMATLKTVVVAGGAGFIGANLCRKLAQKFNVIIADNLSTGSFENISELCTLPNVQFIEHDILKPLDLEADYIVNLACPASPPHYQKDPIKTTLTNVLGTHNLLALASHNKAVFVQASTSEVYGDPLDHPQKELYRGNVSCTGPRACYDEGKRCAESLCFDFLRQHKTRIKIARIFNTYGPYMDINDGRVVSNFIIQALQNKPITIYGTGEQTRSFCFVDDLVDGLIALMLSPDTVTGPINIGNDNESTLLNLAGIISSMTSCKAPLAFAKLPVDDPTRRKPDLSLAKELLKWQPTTRLDAGLRITIKYFKNKLAALQKTAPTSTQHMPSVYS